MVAHMILRKRGEMKIGDLGTLKGPVVFFGGPYSNLQATQALLAEAEAQGVPPGNLICTGDIAAYCAQPVETITLLRDSWEVLRKQTGFE